MDTPKLADDSARVRRAATSAKCASKRTPLQHLGGVNTRAAPASAQVLGLLRDEAPSKGKGKSKAAHSSLLDENDTIKTVARIRPLSDAGGAIRIEKAKEGEAVLCLPEPDRRRKASSVFRFDQVFGPEAGQEDVFAATAKPLIETVLGGENAVLFAYGVTGSGKSHTMQGTKRRPGIIPQTLRYTFEQLLPLTAEGKGPAYTVSISYFEIYNEKIYDLLADISLDGTFASDKPKGEKCRVALELKYSPSIHIPDLKVFPVETYDQCMTLVRLGQANRRTFGTLSNEQSSRSHCSLVLRISQTVDHLVVRESRLDLVDLAGSERRKAIAMKDHAREGTTSLDDRAKEGANINLGLMVLNRCLEALRTNQKAQKIVMIPPFRESKLTAIFEDVMTGQVNLARGSRTGPAHLTMIVNVSPCAEEFGENVRVLEAAASARSIQTWTSAQPLEALAGPISEMHRPSDEATLRVYMETTDKIFDHFQQKEEAHKAEMREWKEDIKAQVLDVLSFMLEKSAEEKREAVEEVTERYEAILRSRKVLEKKRAAELRAARLGLSPSATEHEIREASAQVASAKLEQSARNARTFRIEESGMAVRSNQTFLEKLKMARDAQSPAAKRPCRRA